MSVCASCGKQIETGAISCSSCGHPVSLDPRNANPNVSSDNSEDRDVLTDRRAAVKRGLRWGAIFLGASVIVSLTFVGIVGIGVMVAISGNNETTVALVQVGIALICYVFGGLIVGFGVGFRGTLHGMLSALIADIVLVIYTLIGMLRTEISVGWIILALTVELLILSGFGALGGFLGERLRNRSSHYNRP